MDIFAARLSAPASVKMVSTKTFTSPSSICRRAPQMLQGDETGDTPVLVLQAMYADSAPASL